MLLKNTTNPYEGKVQDWCVYSLHYWANCTEFDMNWDPKSFSWVSLNNAHWLYTSTSAIITCIVIFWGLLWLYFDRTQDESGGGWHATKRHRPDLDPRLRLRGHGLCTWGARSSNWATGATSPAFSNTNIYLAPTINNQEEGIQIYCCFDNLN